MHLRTSLLALTCGTALLAGCGGSSTVDVGGPPPDPTIPAQGPCDEPLLDGDVVAGPATTSASVVAVGLVLADGPLYESVESLAAAAALVVRGTIGPVVDDVDDGVELAAIRTVDVAEVLAGEAPDELRVVFGLGDTAGERCAPVVEGREVVLFLTTTRAGGATHGVMGSHNNGVLTVDGGDALTHSWVPDRLRDGDPGRDDLPADGGFPPPGLRLDLDAIREVVD